MDLNIDFKNLNVQDLKAKILKFADKKTLIKIGISAGAIILFLIIYYTILNPIVNKKKLQLDKMNEMKQETSKFISDIKSKQNKIKKLKPEYNKYSTLFHTRSEVEGLYETLSYYAGLNNLIITKIEKQDIKGVSKADALAKASGKKSKKKKTKKKDPSTMAYYLIPVTFEITGNFLGYIKFKRALSKSKKMLNFDKESIKVVKTDSTSTIIATGELTILGLTNEFY